MGHFVREQVGEVMGLTFSALGSEGLVCRRENI